MEILFAAGATVDKMTVFGTALSEAVRSNKTDAVNLLLDRGANVNVRETYGGGSPLSTATIQNNVAMAALLLKRGARPDDTKGSHNALLLATGAGNHEMVKLLRSHGGTPGDNDKDGNGELSVEEANSVLIPILLDDMPPEHIDPIFDRNGDGKPTKEEVAQALVSAGVRYNVLLRDQEGEISRVADQLQRERLPKASPLESQPVPPR